jgi:hypothetical protein
MKLIETDYLKASLEAAQWKALYFQARDEIRKANKGLARLSRHNQVLRQRIMEVAAKPAARTTLVDEILKRSKPITNGNGALHT